MRQPDWDVDKARGEEAEALFRKVRGGLLAGTTEVKRDDRTSQTGNVYIEYECRTATGWKPSGIATTKATTWVIYTEPVMTVMPTWVLKKLCRKQFKEKGHHECGNGSHPTRGVVIPIRELVPMAQELWHAPISEKDAA